MRIAGVWLIGLGLLALIAAFILPTSVNTPGSSYLEAIGQSGSVINIGLLQRQALVFHAGLTSILAGVVLIAAGGIIDAGARFRPQESTAPPEVLPSHAAVESGPPTPIVPADADRAVAYVLGIIAAIMLVALIFVVSGGGNAVRSPEAVAITNNAEALADQMEAEADNLEAMADRMELERR